MTVKFDRPFLLRRSQMRVTWGTLHKADQFGYHRGMYDALVAQSSTARLIVLPFGQASPPHQSSGEHLHFQVRSDIEFEMAGEKYLVSPNDLFFIPAGVRYGYANVGDEDALFLSVHSRVEDWPPRVEYLD
jgi:mannose-6-phosphate isomerase-like protein (cupin superfamily)